MNNGTSSRCSDLIHLSSKQKLCKYYYSDAAKSLFSASESMLANCINQYLNADYEVRKTGDPNDLIDVFLFYYSQVPLLSPRSTAKLKYGNSQSSKTASSSPKFTSYRITWPSCLKICRRLCGMFISGKRTSF